MGERSSEKCPSLSWSFNEALNLFGKVFREVSTVPGDVCASETAIMILLSFCSVLNASRVRFYDRSLGRYQIFLYINRNAGLGLQSQDDNSNSWSSIRPQPYVSRE